jgi:hypothetical protein
LQTSIEVKRIDLWTLFRLAFFIYAAIGLIIGLFYAFILAIASSFGDVLADEGLPGMGLITGVVGVVMVPVFSFIYGAMGAVVITIGGAIFNLVSRLSGGIRFDVALVQPVMTAPAAPAPNPYAPPSPSPEPPLTQRPEPPAPRGPSEPPGQSEPRSPEPPGSGMPRTNPHPHHGED